MARLTKRTNEQTRKRTKKRPNKTKLTKAVYLFVSLSFVSLLVFAAVWWFSGWNGKVPVNIVISSGENLWVLSLRPDQRQALQIAIPQITVIEVTGRGKWQARALWEISRLENDPSLVAAIGWNLLEVPIDMVLRLDDWRGTQTSYVSLFPTNWRHLPQEFRIVKFLKSLNQNQIKDIDLSNINIFHRVVDPGGGELIEISPQLLSPRAEEWFRLDGLQQEGLTLAIRNSSSRPGAGGLLARQLEHIGLRVVSVADGAGEHILTVRDKQLKKSLSVRKLSAWLKTKPVVAAFPERADILIVVK